MPKPQQILFPFEIFHFKSFGFIFSFFIRLPDRTYKIGDQIFTSIDDMLQFYTRHLLDKSTLKSPLNKDLQLISNSRSSQRDRTLSRNQNFSFSGNSNHSLDRRIGLGNRTGSGFSTSTVNSSLNGLRSPGSNSLRSHPNNNFSVSRNNSGRPVNSNNTPKINRDKSETLPQNFESLNLNDTTNHHTQPLNDFQIINNSASRRRASTKVCQPQHKINRHQKHSQSLKVPRKNQVIGLYDFAGQDGDDLPFRKGEILTVIEKQEEQWWTAKNEFGDIGHIPVPYIKIFNVEGVFPV